MKLHTSFQSAICCGLICLPALQTEAQPRIQWSRMYDLGSNERLTDIYARQSEESGYYVCGNKMDNGFWQAYVSSLDAEGNVNWTIYCGPDNGRGIAYTIIEVDNGDAIVGGKSGGNQILIARIAGNGQQIWARAIRSGETTGVIELKSGDLMLCGKNNNRAFILRMNGDGEEIWYRQYYQIENGRASFEGLREIEDDVIAAGNFNCDSIPGGHLWAVRLTQQHGDTLWQRDYHIDESDRCYAFTSTGDGHFLLAGSVKRLNVNDQHPSKDVAVLRIDGDGREVWSERFPFDENDGGEALTGICRLSRNRFGIVGYRMDGGQNFDFRPFCMEINGVGEKLWERLFILQQVDGYGVGRNAYHYLLNCVRAHDGAFLAVGGVTYERDGTGLNNWLVKLEPENTNLQILRWSPADTTLSHLPGESICFSAFAFDPQGRELRYSWSKNGAELNISDTTYSADFPELGDTDVQCKVVAEDERIAITWHISVRDLFVYSHTPDTLELTLRRGTTQEFTLDSIAVTEGMSVNYAWTLTDIDNFDRFDLGEDSSVSVEFLRSGNYSVEGLAYRGEAQDNVVWTVRVRSAILDFSPGELSLSVLPDSLVNFEVIPFNPESDSLSFRWELDGDSVGAEAALGFRFAGDGDTIRSSRVAAMVFDGGEGDTVEWNVRVTPPAAAREFRIKNLEFRMGEPAPNPFNATTTISYALDKPGRTTLSVFDLSGREVARLVEGSREAGVHSAAWEASGVPAGVYLLRLESGGRIAVGKAVVVR